ncbi:MAG: hypothetical protein ACI82I_000517 [Gammaproteobacteria bacterium]|jgi:hypothetical protein
MQDESPPEMSRRRSPWGVLRVVALLFALPIVFAGVVGVMLINTDVHAPEWVKSRIEGRAAALMQGGTLEFGQIFVNIGKDLHPRVRLFDTRINDANGIQIARIPSVTGLMSPRGLLFQGDVLMQDVALHGAQINLRRAADGSVALAFDGGGGFESAPSMVALLDQVDQFLDRPAFAALEQISASGLIVNYTDVRAGRAWTVDGGELKLDLRDDQTALFGDFSLLSGGADVTRLQLNYDSPRGSHAAQVSLSVTDARASDMATQTPALAWLSGVDAAITASLRSSLDADGALGPLSATLDLGAGALQPNAATDPVTFDGAKAYLTYDPTTDLISFDQIEVDAAAGRINASGRAYLRDKVDGIPQALVAQFAFPEITLAQGEWYPDGLVVPPLSVDMRLLFDPFAVELGQVALVEGDTHVIGSGLISATLDGWRAAIDLQADQMATERFTDFWPKTLKKRSRDWLDRNVAGGIVRDAAVGIRAVQGERPVMAARFDFEESDITFMRTMPPISGARGVGHMQDGQLVMSLDRGFVTARQGGRAELAGTTFKVLDTRRPGGDAELNLVLNSTITAALSLLDREPFEFISKANQSVTMAQGRAFVTGVVRFPLVKGVPRDQISYEIAADLHDLRSDTIIMGRALRADRMRLNVDNAGMQIAGPVSLDGVAADAVWDNRFGGANAGKSQMRATVDLSPRFLDAFNIALPDGTVTGSGQGDLVVDLAAGSPPAFRLTSNLRGIELALPAVGWRKSPSAGGDLVVAGTLGDAPQVTTLEVSGGGLQAKGAVTLNGNGTLNEARFSQVQIGDWLNARVTLRGRGKGRPVGVSIGQGRVDLRGAAFGAGRSDAGPLALRLDRLQITEGIALHDFQGDFDGSGGFSGDFTGRVNGGPQVLGTVTPQNGRSAIRLLSDDAGGVVGAAGFMKNGVGGSLDLTLRPAGDAGTFDGDLLVRDLRVRDAPAMAALLDSISVVGLLRQLDGQGLAFDEVDATFRLTPSQVIVTQSSAVGPGLGISLDGIYTLASKQIDFQGVVSPFYLLNGIGAFLTRKGEGLIGFNFNLTGAVAAPVVSVNPLSAFTPGMFREIFRRAPPEVTQ